MNFDESNDELNNWNKKSNFSVRREANSAVSFAFIYPQVVFWWFLDAQDYSWVFSNVETFRRDIVVVCTPPSNIL